MKVMSLGMKCMTGFLSDVMIAFTTMCLWNWFVAHQFNMPVLTLFHAWGIGILIQILTIRKPTRKQIVDEIKLQEELSEPERFNWDLARDLCMILVYLSALIMGFIVHLFI